MKTYEKSIPFYKLYSYSLKYPFKYIKIYLENDINDIIFDKSLKRRYFKLRYSFPFVGDVIKSMIEEFNNDNKLNIDELSGSAYGNALEIKIRENLNKFEEKIDIRKVWALNLISDAVKRKKFSDFIKNKYFSKLYRDLEDINQIKDIKSSNFEYFYFKPENQDNKYFDSLFLIKIKDKEFCMIALQITKNKNKKSVKTKRQYSDFLINNVKKKFEDLYDITISNFYLWFILSYDLDDNASLCKILDNSEIKYLFFSIKEKYFYEKRNGNKIESLKYLTNDK